MDNERADHRTRRGYLGYVRPMRLVLLVALLGTSVGCKGAAEESKFQKEKVDIARLQVKQLANAAYPQWSMSHPDKECPAALDELAEYTSNAGKPFVDPWGQPLSWACGPSLPPGARGLAAWSSGPDKKRDTPDDVRSWEPKTP
jgi:hypothetical protein